MQSIGLSRGLFGCNRSAFTTVALFVGMMGPVGNAGAQEVPGASGMARHAAAPTSLHELIQEAEQKNPQIAASIHAWQASRDVPKQVSALPETQLSLQQLSVGSPDPLPVTATAISPTSDLACLRTCPTRANGSCAPMWPNMRPIRWKRRVTQSEGQLWEI